MSFNDSWTKKDLKNECMKRGISWQGLRNKNELIEALNSHHVDDSWTKKELKAECSRRGLRNFSNLTKEGLIQLLNHGTYSRLPGGASQISNPYDKDDDEQAIPDGADETKAPDGADEAKVPDGEDEAKTQADASWTKKQLKAECRRRGLRGFSNLTKSELIQLLNHGTGAVTGGTSHASTSHEADDDEKATSDGEDEEVDASWTKKELLEECRRRDLRLYMYLTKAELIKLLNTGTGASLLSKLKQHGDSVAMKYHVG